VISGLVLIRDSMTPGALLDGMVTVGVDGGAIAEVGPGAIVGERAVP